MHKVDGSAHWLLGEVAGDPGGVDVERDVDLDCDVLSARSLSEHPEAIPVSLGGILLLRWAEGRPEILYPSGVNRAIEVPCGESDVQFALVAKRCGDGALHLRLRALLGDRGIDEHEQFSLPVEGLTIRHSPR